MVHSKKGSISLDIIISTALILIVIITLNVIYKTGNLISRSSIEVIEFQSRVQSHMTDLELSGNIGGLHNTTNIIDGVKYSYTVANSGFGTETLTVTAYYKNRTFDFILDIPSG